MTSDRRAGLELAASLRGDRSIAALSAALHASAALLPGALERIPGGSLATSEAVERRWRRIASHRLDMAEAVRDELLDPRTARRLAAYERNIEQLIGCVSLPLGLAGPLLVNGLHAQGAYLVPLATTEAALVASYSRGARLISEAGGCSALLLAEGVSRSPGFVFADLAAVGRFVLWVLEQQEAFVAAAASTTRHGRLEATRLSVEGNHVILLFDFSTGDAAGQNMVTIATRAICEFILRNSPEQPLHWFLEVNLSGDKKASTQSFSTVRGRKVTAEVLLPAELVRRRLHTTPERMVEYWRFGALGGVMSGTIGVQGHVANGLAALFIACGQDAACVAEAAVGVTRMELQDGDLYAAVTLPNLIVGTVGGGTGLPAQRACLELLGLAGAGCARAFAEVCAALALAGELSITGALCADQFAQAHQKLAR
ncbi:MAG: hydroxymethylglutaryl-CoA reductase [Vulcanococcus sp.]